MKIPKPKKAPSIKQLRSKADGLWQQAVFKKWGDKCVCNQPAYCGHHFYYKGSYGHLRYDLDNGVPICSHCHFLVHTKDPKKIEDKIKEKRGDQWLKDLRLKANQTPSSYRGVKWYKENIEFLEEYINKVDYCSSK